MKILFYSLSFIALSTSISSCNKRPDANFTVNGSSFSVGDTITVTNNSKNSNGARWVVYDGTATSGSVSSHVQRISGGQTCDMSYSFAIDTVGTFTMPLKAYNWKKSCEEGESGKYDEQTVTIQVQ